VTWSLTANREPGYHWARWPGHEARIVLVIGYEGEPAPCAVLEILGGETPLALWEKFEFGPLIERPA
jgi:hypothetical protein